MSFRNTKTPTMKEINGKAIHPIKMESVNGVNRFYLDDETKAHFIRLFPITMNRDLMRMFGVSFSTIQRLKRELSLEKNMDVIRRKQAKLTKKICEENGYYDSIRGRSPSNSAIEATKKLFEEGFHPMLQLKKNNRRRYNAVCKKRSETRKQLIKKETFRINLGIPQSTNLHIPFSKYTRQQTCFRNNMKRKGYILGDAFGYDRMTIYYDKHTDRKPISERNGLKYKFSFKSI